MDESVADRTVEEHVLAGYDMVGTLLRRLTLLPIAEIEKLEALEGKEINEAKKILAFETSAASAALPCANSKLRPARVLAMAAGRASIKSRFTLGVRRGRAKPMEKPFPE